MQPQRREAKTATTVSTTTTTTTRENSKLCSTYTCQRDEKITCKSGWRRATWTLAACLGILVNMSGRMRCRIKLGSKRKIKASLSGIKKIISWWLLKIERLINIKVHEEGRDGHPMA